MSDAVIVALIGLGATVLSFFLGRLGKHADKKEEKDTAEQEELKALRAELAEQKSIIAEQAVLVAQVPNISTALCVFLEDRLRFIGRSFLKKGEITDEEFDGWKRMHAAYHGVGGNGYFDAMLIDLSKLPRKYQ